MIVGGECQQNKHNVLRVLASSTKIISLRRVLGVRFITLWMVLNSVDQASLWKTIITELDGRFSVAIFFSLQLWKKTHTIYKYMISKQNQSILRFFPNVRKRSIERYTVTGHQVKSIDPVEFLHLTGQIRRYNDWHSVFAFLGLWIEHVSIE